MKKEESSSVRLSWVHILVTIVLVVGMNPAIGFAEAINEALFSNNTNEGDVVDLSTQPEESPGEETVFEDPVPPDQTEDKNTDDPPNGDALSTEALAAPTAEENSVDEVTTLAIGDRFNDGTLVYEQTGVDKCKVVGIFNNTVASVAIPVSAFDGVTYFTVTGVDISEPQTTSALTTINANTYNINLSYMNTAGLGGTLLELQAGWPSQNSFTALDMSSNPNLQVLTVNDNPSLSSINTAGLTKLKNVQTHGCGLTSLDLSGNADLTVFTVFGNVSLTNLNLSDCSSLTEISSGISGCSPLIDIDISNTGFTAFDAFGISMKSMTAKNCANLTRLDCSGNGLTSVDVTGSTALEELYLGWHNGAVNDLASLDLSTNTALRALEVGDNASLTSIIVNAPDTLESLSAHNSGLTSLDLSGHTKLTVLNVYDAGNLAAIDVSGCTLLTAFSSYALDGCAGLKSLDISNTGFTTVDLAVCPGIETLDISGTAFPSFINDPGNLKTLIAKDCTALTTVNCSGNDLEHIDVAGSDALEVLSLGWSSTSNRGNSLTSLDFSTNTALEAIDIAENPLLTSVVINAPDTLESLSVHNSGITSLDLSDHTLLTTLALFGTADLTEIDLSGCAALTSFLPLGLEGCGALETLDISGTGFTEFDNDGGNLNTLIAKNCADLTSINCNGNGLTSIDVEGSTALEHLHLGWSAYNALSNDLTSLDLSTNNALKELEVGDNANLTSITLNAANTLESLSVHNCGIEELDVSGYSKLSTLNIHGDLDLKSLNISGCVLLDTLNFTDGALEELYVNNCSALTYVDVAGHNLVTLETTGSTALESLYIDRNPCLSEIDITTNTGLLRMDCSSCALSELEFGGATGIEELNCADNQFASLDVSSLTALWYLNCADNQLSELDVSSNGALNNLDCSNNKLLCLCGFNPALTITFTGSGQMPDPILLYAFDETNYVGAECGLMEHDHDFTYGGIERVSYNLADDRFEVPIEDVSGYSFTNTFANQVSASPSVSGTVTFAIMDVSALIATPATVASGGTTMVYATLENGLSTDQVKLALFDSKGVMVGSPVALDPTSTCPFTMPANTTGSSQVYTVMISVNGGPWVDRGCQVTVLTQSTDDPVKPINNGGKGTPTAKTGDMPLSGLVWLITTFATCASFLLYSRLKKGKGKRE